VPEIMKNKWENFLFALIFFILTIPCYAQQTSIFTVYGEVFLSDGVTHAPDGNIVTVKNLNTGIFLSTTVGSSEPGKYTVVFTDFTGNRAAAVGDVIQTIVKSPEDELLASPAPHTVVAADITAKRVRVNITFPGGVNAGTITLDAPGPPVWSYTLTQNSGSVTEWSYNGAGITGAGVVGTAQVVGWIVSTQTSTQVVFTATATPLTSGSLSGFQIMGTVGGTGAWTCHANSSPIDGSLPVELSAFVAISTENGVTLKWRIESGVNNIGFAIYRSDTRDGKFTKVAFIEGKGNSGMPTDYLYVDKTAKPDKTYYYYLEDVDIDGIRTKSPVVMSRKLSNAATTWGQLKKLNKWHETNFLKN